MICRQIHTHNGLQIFVESIEVESDNCRQVLSLRPYEPKPNILEAKAFLSLVEIEESYLPKSKLFAQVFDALEIRLIRQLQLSVGEC